MHQFKIYLAGPDVFRADYADVCAKLKAICLAAGFTGVSPVDGDVLECPENERSLRIYENNVSLIQDADIVMANVQNFRGNEPDSGTVFEIGYAAALGKPVWCYNVPRVNLVDQVVCDHNFQDAHGYHVENFGLPRNLMLAHSTKLITGDADECMEAISRFCKGDEIADIPALTGTIAS